MVNAKTLPNEYTITNPKIVIIPKILIGLFVTKYNVLYNRSTLWLAKLLIVKKNVTKNNNVYNLLTLLFCKVCFIKFVKYLNLVNKSIFLFHTFLSLIQHCVCVCRAWGDWFLSNFWYCKSYIMKNAQNNKLSFNPISWIDAFMMTVKIEEKSYIYHKQCKYTFNYSEKKPNLLISCSRPLHQYTDNT